MSQTPQTSSNPTAPSQAELAQRLIAGDITPAQFLGLSQEQLYVIATTAHRLLAQGQTQQALTLFKGLVAASPYDSVFHCNLAAAYVQAELYSEAMEEYSRAIQLNIANVDALAGRSELLLREGRVAEALNDLQAVLRLDPKAERETTQRARTTLVLLNKLADSAETAEPPKQP
ncbi:tetratricopeptide repeat protein [Hyalangium minutum]|uniref:Tetratricopeptide repeat protein n=1 Tax=Hyalangium minutum TaxID=394096 RepID=A0A085WC30_9BACT|nr:tetratricopeptide repeat protein [Hyalangium minutum]KFE65243.1 tetratricopeptide repeat protein [Hyalangium minutum]